MKRKGAFQIFAEKRLIVMYESGDVDIDDLISSQKIISNESDYDPSFDIILDLRDSFPVVNEKDIKRYIDFVQSNKKLIGERKCAYITSKPVDVVAVTIFSLKKNDLPIETEIFSTVSGVANWFKYKNIDNEFVSNTIDELKSGSDIL